MATAAEDEAEEEPGTPTCVFGHSTSERITDLAATWLDEEEAADADITVLLSPKREYAEAEATALDVTIEKFNVTMLLQDWAAQRVQEEIAKIDAEEAQLEGEQELERQLTQEAEDRAYRADNDPILLPVHLASTSEELIRVSIRLVDTVEDLALAIMRNAALPLRPSLSCNGCRLDASATLKAAGVGEESRVLAEVHAAIVTCSEDKTARIWDTDTGKCELVLRGHTDTVTSAGFSPDNSLIVTCSDDCTVKVWSLATGECLQTLRGHSDSVTFAIFSPDWASVLTASDDCTVKLWSVKSWSCVCTMSAHTGAVYVARFSDGGTITTAARDGRAFLWDASTGKYIRTLHGKLPELELYSYSPCGRFTATASSVLETKIWNIETGECARILGGHEQQVTHALFSPASAAMVAAAKGRAIP